MPAQSKTFVFNVGSDANKTPIRTTSITYPPVSYMPTTIKGPTTYYSDKEKGDGYYGGKGLHTVTYIPWLHQPNSSPHVSNNFRGTIVIQGTLAEDPQEVDWFDISGTETTYTDESYSSIYHNFSGNFVWIRAKVTISAGVLQAIHYNH